MPHGAVMANWTPADEGRAEALADPGAARGVQGSGRRPQQSGARDGRPAGSGRQRRRSHALPGGVPERRASRSAPTAPTSSPASTIDQMAAAKIGQDTLLPSLELAIEDYSGLVGSCDVGFSCTYMNTISWRTPTAPMPMEINPRVVFDRMFGDGATAERAAAAHRNPAQHSRCGHRPGPPPAGRTRCRAIAIAWPSISTRCAKSNAAFSSPRSRASNPNLDVPDVADAAFRTTTRSTRN